MLRGAGLLWASHDSLTVESLSSVILPSPKSMSGGSSKGKVLYNSNFGIMFFTFNEHYCSWKQAASIYDACTIINGDIDKQIVYLSK